VEIVRDDHVMQRSRVHLSRPDVAAVYQGAPQASTSGFTATLDMIGIPETRLVLRSVLADGTRVPLASLLAQPCWAEDDVELPLVSVVVSGASESHCLSEAIESALAQTYPDIEVVIVDDCPGSHTGSIAGRYPGVRAVPQSGGGRAGACNTGLRTSSGEYLIFLDARDRLRPTCVATGLDVFRRHRDTALVCGRAQPISGRIGPEVHLAAAGGGIAELLRRTLLTGAAAVLFRRSLFDIVGVFRESAAPCEEYDVCLRTASVFPIRTHEGLVAEHHSHPLDARAQDAERIAAAMRIAQAQRRQASGHSAAMRRLRDRGVRDLRQWCGRAIVSGTRDALRTRQWRDVLRGVMALGRWHPGDVFRALHR
jgi:GT2 family glycosyltransferase